MANINYAKFENLDKNRLVGEYTSIEKKRDKALKQLQEYDELLKFLGDKITVAFTTKEPKFYTIKTSPILNKINNDFKKLNQTEQDELKNQLKQELGY